jgi:hypothetical protein
VTHVILLPLQARVFQKVSTDTIKIVVATNVAETSITIDDIVCVIDSGRVKEIRCFLSQSLYRSTFFCTQYLYSMTNVLLHHIRIDGCSCSPCLKSGKPVMLWS